MRGEEENQVFVACEPVFENKIFVVKNVSSCVQSGDPEYFKHFPALLHPVLRFIRGKALVLSVNRQHIINRTEEPLFLFCPVPWSWFVLRFC